MLLKKIHALRTGLRDSVQSAEGEISLILLPQKSSIYVLKTFHIQVIMWPYIFICTILKSYIFIFEETFWINWILINGFFSPNPLH